MLTPDLFPPQISTPALPTDSSVKTTGASPTAGSVMGTMTAEIVRTSPMPPVQVWDGTGRAPWQGRVGGPYWEDTGDSRERKGQGHWGRKDGVPSWGRASRGDGAVWEA